MTVPDLWAAEAAAEAAALEEAAFWSSAKWCVIAVTFTICAGCVFVLLKV